MPDLRSLRLPSLTGLTRFNDRVNHEDLVNPVKRLLLRHLCELVGEGVDHEFETIRDAEF